MKTKSLKPVLLAIATVVFTSFYGCGGASGNSGSSAGGSFNEAEVVGDRADMSAGNSGVSYAELFSNVDDTENHDILALVGMDDNFSTFARLARLSNLNQKLSRVEQVTVFVPTNEAFQNMPEEEFEKLVDPRNRAQLARFLQRHVLPGKVTTIDFDGSQAIETASEEEITIDTEANGDLIFIGGARIVKSDIDASNGVVHIVNSVIEPSRDVFVD